MTTLFCAFSVSVCELQLTKSSTFTFAAAGSTAFAGRDRDIAAVQFAA